MSLRLRDGDHLTQDEFLRRWEAMPELKHAELIGGVVHMPSPVKLTHSNLHSLLGAWIAYFAVPTSGCASVPQPDVSLRILPDCGGQSGIENDLAVGAPELAMEISVSTRSRDHGTKLRLYERAGVLEYITAVPKARQFIWRELVDGHYRVMAADRDGILRSRCFPGLWIDPGSLWVDGASIFAVLQRGLASPEHARFIQALAARKSRSTK